MHTPTAPIHPQRKLARQVRERMVEGLCAGLSGMDKALMEFLTALMSQTGTQREMQNRRDAWQMYQQSSGGWLRGVTGAWRATLAGAPLATPSGRQDFDLSFELVDDDVVENKILASRMALTVMEQVSGNFESLRLRIQVLEGVDMPASDILRPETVALTMVESWVKAGLPRADLQTILDPLQRELADLMQKVYQACNDFLQAQGVQAQQDLRVRVNRSPASGAGGLQTGPASRALEQSQEALSSMRGMAQPSGRGMPSRMAPPGSAYGMAHGAVMSGGMTPLARARQRAYGVVGQLRRLMSTSATGFDMVNAPPASAALAHALAAHRVQAETYYSTVGGAVPDYSPAAVVQLAGVVRNRATEFKKKADTEGEKAIIEVVALMFQSILAEDRIPSAVRVWFARLQVPVLRVALAEPEFFSNLNHPARQLIDRMGSCALGFDATSISGSALEAEVKRIVQVIEQYPETGRRVFQLVYDEFEKFLAKFLTEKQATSRLVSVAQQVEQKEALAINYTIELRTMLKRHAGARRNSGVFVQNLGRGTGPVCRARRAAACRHDFLQTYRGRLGVGSQCQAQPQRTCPGDPELAGAAAAPAPGTGLTGRNGRAAGCAGQGVDRYPGRSIPVQDGSHSAGAYRGTGQAPGEPGRVHRRCGHGRYAARR